LRLFVPFILRRLLHEPLWSGVTVVGIALGIAVVVSIQLANESSVRGFQEAIDTISGKTSLEITGPGTGIEEGRLSELVWLSKFGQVTPVLEGSALLSPTPGVEEWVQVLGVDILRDRPFRDYQLLEFAEQHREPRAQEFLSLLLDSHAVVLTEKFARRHGIAVGRSLTITLGDKAESFRVTGLLKDEGPARALDGNFALMDIAAAQLWFGRLGRIDRIEIWLYSSADIETAERAIAQRLPKGLEVARPSRRGRQVEKMLQAFHFNLTALSYIALLVGLFLVYNTASISAVSRREEIGTLRALGTRRHTVLGLFLSEAAALALAGCVLGVALGRLLAYGAITLTSTTVKSLYIATAAAPAALRWRHVALAFAVGLPLALVAAAFPSLEAARVPPLAAIRGYDRLETRFRLKARYLWIPVVLLSMAGWFSTFPAVNGLPLFGYAAAASVAFGAAFMVPAVLFAMGRLSVRPVARLFRVEGRLANASLAAAIPRAAVSVAALAMSLSMMVAIAVMVSSFRQTVITWIDQTLQADLYLRPATRTNVSIEATLSPEVEEAVTAHPGVTAVDRFRNFDVPYEGGLVTVGAGEFAVLLRHGKLLFKAPANWSEAVQGALGQDAVVVSESFAIKYHKSIGAWVRLPTPTGASLFRVVAIYYDYSSDRGVLVMDRSTFVRHFGEQRPTSLAIYLSPRADAELVKSEILKTLGPHRQVLVFSNSSLRSEILRIFDSTFAITYALEVIAIFVAILGVASTLLTLILERRREIAILRLIGAEQRQVRKMVVIEAAFLGSVSQIIGISAGLLLSLVLIYVINLQSFGWTLQFHLPVAFLVQSSILVLLATSISGLYPAHRASQLRAAEQAEFE
jgi:putative ABC transport system permease protein